LLGKVLIPDLRELRRDEGVDLARFPLSANVDQHLK
jgi:hypothetical protein